MTGARSHLGADQPPSAIPGASREVARRTFLAAASVAVLASTRPARAQGREIRIGYQKFNTLNILKGTGKLEQALQDGGVKVAGSSSRPDPSWSRR